MPHRALPVVLALCVCACVDRGAGDTGGDASDTGAAASTDLSEGTGASTEATTPTSTGLSEETGASTGPAACEPYTIEPSIPTVEARVVLLLDRSPAMLDPWDHDQDPQTADEPRWASVRRAVLATVPGDLDVLVGLAGYPTADAQDGPGPEACAVTPGLFTAPAEVDAATLADLLPAEQPPPGSFVGGSPLRAGLLAALDLVAPRREQPRAIVLIGASAANCAADPRASLLEDPDDEVVAAAQAVAGAEVFLAVVGVGASATPNPVAVDGRPDGAAPLATLTEVAGQAGGTLVNAEDEAGLMQALGGLFTDMTDPSCTIDLAPAPGPDQAVAEVRVDGQVVPGPLADCQGETGWRQPEPELLELCGAACTQFIASSKLAIDVACTM